MGKYGDDVKKKWSVSEIAVTGVMIATLEAAKQAMAVIPNVELVTLLIILYTLYFGRQVFYAIAAFVLLEGCLYGFGIWWVSYLYIWHLLAVVVRLFRKQDSVLFWSICSGAFGLCFGGLCAIPYLFYGGVRTAFAWWVAGIPFDLIHCVSNFLLCMVLFRPLRRCMEQIG